METRSQQRTFLALTMKFWKLMEDILSTCYEFSNLSTEGKQQKYDAASEIRGECGIMESHFVFGYYGLSVSLNLRNDTSMVRKFFSLSDAVTKIMIWETFLQKFSFQ
jgi:hypothetical protein